MALFHIDPEDDERECPVCRGGMLESGGACAACLDTGRIGGEKEPEIETVHCTTEDFPNGGWFWQHPPGDGPLCGNPAGDNSVYWFTTEAEALAAARAALGGK